jgi:2,4-dienoyl-CoA reductase-like NADH-dependent reductase (Old Yellow Enzyme family)
MSNQPLLFQALQLRGLTLPNRIIVSPMCQYSAINGVAQTWHRAHLGQFMISGTGLLILEATAVEPIGRITAGCLGLYDDQTELALASVLAELRQLSDQPIAIQLGHAGRKASSGRPWEGGQQVPLEKGGWKAVAPSATPHNAGEWAPHALGLDDLAALKKRFVDSTQRADRLGFDAIELHAAHGYLLHEFLSPIANQRQDQYGGSLANRMRYPLEVFEAMRAVWPQSKPLGLRLSASDWCEHLPAHWALADAIEFSRQLDQRGVDWIDVSSGGISPAQKIAVGPGYQVPFAAAIKAQVSCKVMTVGMITEPQQAENILKAGQADMIALARGITRDPRWAWNAAMALGGQVKAPQQYWRSQPSGFKDLFGETTFGQR